MSTSGEKKPAERKRRNYVVFIIPLFFGLLCFYRVAQSPQFASYRTLHVIQLVVSGASLGIALTGIVLMLRRRNTHSVPAKK
jgi:hypothetical protein